MSKFAEKNAVKKGDEKVMMSNAEGEGGEAPAPAPCLDLLSNLGTYGPNDTTRKRKVS